MADGNLLFIGVKGSALALDRATGEIVWNTHLAGSEFVYVAMADGALYASARGEMFCLDPTTGQVRWSNPLKGYGWGIVSIATGDGGQAVLGREKKRRDDAAAVASTTAAT
jgi:outer membrane protein assembly factor BamB